jgi:hypothetical protein
LQRRHNFKGDICEIISNKKNDKKCARILAFFICFCYNGKVGKWGIVERVAQRKSSYEILANKAQRTYAVALERRTCGCSFPCALLQGQSGLFAG